MKKLLIGALLGVASLSVQAYTIHGQFNTTYNVREGNSILFTGAIYTLYSLPNSYSAQIGCTIGNPSHSVVTYYTVKAINFPPYNPSYYHQVFNLYPAPIPPVNFTASTRENPLSTLGHPRGLLITPVHSVYSREPSVIVVRCGDYIS